MRLLTVSFGVPIRVREDADLQFAQYMRQHGGAIEEILQRLGLPEEHKRPHMSKEEEDEFRRVIWADPAWRQHVIHVLSASFGYSVVLSDEDFASISIPWWNEPVLGCIFPVSGWWKGSACYLPTVLSCLPSDQQGFIIGPKESVSMHSYAVMLQRKYSWLQGGTRAIGVAVLVRTSDGYFVLGRRAGDYESGKLAIVPAGSASFHASGLSASRELFEELGIRIKDGPLELAGAYEHDDSRLVYVYTVDVKLSRQDVLRRWKEAPDAWEHSELVFLSTDGLRSKSQGAIFHPKGSDLSRFSLGAISIGVARMNRDKLWLRDIFQNEPEFADSLPLV